jgi:hypothetical protein
MTSKISFVACGPWTASMPPNMADRAFFMSVISVLIWRLASERDHLVFGYSCPLSSGSTKSWNCIAQGPALKHRA